MNQAIFLLWAQAQKRTMPWEAVRRKLAPMLEVCVAMHDTYRTKEILFLFDITYTYQRIHWLRKQRFIIVQ